MKFVLVQLNFYSQAYNEQSVFIWISIALITYYLHAAFPQEEKVITPI